MPIDVAQVAKLRADYERAQAQLDKEDAERFRILRKHMGEDAFQRLLDGLTEKEHRILFGLELPEESQPEPAPRERAARAATKGAKTEYCDVCHEGPFTKSGLSRHMSRKHKEQTKQPDQEAGLSDEAS